MKGIVFTEFIEMVEAKFGYEVVDELLSETPLPSGGAYTAIGTYSHHEMVALVVGLSKKTSTPLPTLLYSFGQYLFQTFVKVYGQFFEHTTDAFSFLESIENYIHVEVQKLYPDAELPRFSTQRINDNTLEMIYQSERSMGDLAEGLIAASIKYFNEKATIRRELMGEGGKKERFLITRKMA
jgi:Haem-NO-binding